MFWPRAAAFALAALAAGSAVFWGLKWQGAAASGPSSASQVTAMAQQALGPQTLARALGGTGVLVPASQSASNSTAAVVSASSRMALTGVVSGAEKRGTALIAIDGKPARPFTVGSKVDGELLLQAVEPRRAKLATRLDGPSTVTLELPGTKARP